MADPNGTGAPRESREARERIAELPPELAAVLRPTLPAVADEILTAIRAEVDEYRRPFEGRFGKAVRRGVELSLREFVALVEDPERPEAGTRMIEELGRGEVRSGRTLDALQAAYRSGARVAWRRFADTAHEHGADQATLIRLGDAIFAYIHRLAALSVAGWAQEQALQAGATQRVRDALVRLVIAERAVAPGDLDAAAQDLGWRPPQQVAVVVLPGVDGPGDLLRIDPQVVASVQDGRAIGVVPAVLIDRVVGALAGRGAALGPTVEWPAVARSYRRVQAVLALRDAGHLASPGADGQRSVADATVGTADVEGGAGAVLRAEDHLAAMLVHSDGEAADELAEAVLAPLQRLPDGRRQRHVETARAWLDHRGHGGRMAEALHLHPQTVRYRVARLREALELDLEDPEQRFMLELALRRRGLR